MSDKLKAADYLAQAVRELITSPMEAGHLILSDATLERLKTCAHLLTKYDEAAPAESQAADLQNEISVRSDEADGLAGILASAQARIAELERWKREALTVFNSYDAQEIGRLLGMTLGTDVMPNIQPAIERLIARVAVLEKALEGARDAVKRNIVSVFGQPLDVMALDAINAALAAQPPRPEVTAKELISRVLKIRGEPGAYQTIDSISLSEALQQLESERAAQPSREKEGA